MDADGVVRVGRTRVTLDTVVSAFKNGATAEQIAHDYPVLDLADIYAVITYYLNQRQQVDEYLAERRKAGSQIRETVGLQYDLNGIQDRLLARRESRDTNHASAPRG